MSQMSRKILLMFCIIFGVLFFASDVFAGEEILSGRRIWDNALLIINFGILVFLFLKYAKKPFLGFLYGERDKIKEELSSLDSMITGAGAGLSKEEDKLRNIAKLIEDIKQTNLELGKKEKERIIEEARIRSNQILKKAEYEAHYKLINARKALAHELTDLAFNLVPARLNKAFSTKDDEKLIDRFIIDLEKEKEQFV